MAAVLATADPLVLVGGYDPQVRTFALAADGGLRPLAVSPVCPNPSFIAVAPDARFAYAVSEVSTGRVAACALDRASGSLRVLGTASSGGTGPAYIALHPSGRWLLVANYGDGTVAVLPRRADGGIGEPVCSVAAGANAHMALPSLDGLHVYVPCKGADRVRVFSCDPDTGQLAAAGEAATAAGAGPRHLAIAADGLAGWLVNELDSTVQPAHLRDSGLSFGVPVTTLPPGWMGRNTAGSVLLAGAGRLLLASNRGHDSIAVFRLGAAGEPVPAGHTAVGQVPRHLAQSPDGSFVLAACQGAGRIEVLRLNAATAALTPVGSAPAPHPAWVGVVP